jgi:hypothetical protein
MKERPILFSASMVRALLDGSKTQTRRIMKPQPTPTPADYPGPRGHRWPSDAVQSMVHIEEEMQKLTGMAGDCCPHGDRGDRLRVRETFLAFGRWETRFSPKKERDEWHFVDMTMECDRRYQYAADNPDVPLAKGRGGTLPGWHTRPAIFMPRAASRTLLEIVSVRVERLNDCSESDALAEGVLKVSENFYKGLPAWAGYDGAFPRPDAYTAYYDLWESINGKGSWDTNPFVWILEFKRVTP